MALSPIGPRFWLPSHFLTDEDTLMDKENFNDNGANPVGAEIHGFPSEFPYEFDSFGSSSALNSPVESVMSSTETESDEEDLLTQLKRQLAHSTLHDTQKLAPSFSSENQEKTWVLSGSPQSTLSAVGNWSGRSTVSSNGSPNGRSRVSSPPTTPLSEKTDAWDLIYAAAGQVARLKMSGDGPKYQQGRGLLGPPRSPMPVPAQPAKNANTGFYSYQGLSNNISQTSQSQRIRQEQVLKQQCSVWGREAKEAWFSQQQQQLQQQQQIHSRRSVGLESGRCGRPLGLPPSAWPPLQHQHQQSSSGMRAVFLGGSGLKRESAGTGVFLPRRFGNASDSRKKPGCSTVLLPARVVQALNLNFEDMGSHSQPHFNGGVAPDYEALMARRNALISQQKRNLRPEGTMNHEIRLPQEWTY